jgi:hypothetical protein
MATFFVIDSSHQSARLCGRGGLHIIVEMDKLVDSILRSGLEPDGYLIVMRGEKKRNFEISRRRGGLGILWQSTLRYIFDSADSGGVKVRCDRRGEGGSRTISGIRLRK